MIDSTLPPVNRKRKAAAFLRNYTGPFPGINHAARIRDMPCVGEVGHGCGGDIVAAHAIARGMGGAKGDWSVLVPMCDRFHRYYDGPCANRPEKLQDELGMDVLAIALVLAEDSLALRLEQCETDAERAEARYDFGRSEIAKWRDRQ